MKIQLPDIQPPLRCSAPEQLVESLLCRSDNWTHSPLGGSPNTLRSGQRSISLEYQPYTSAHLFDTQVTGMGGGGEEGRFTEQ